jgi:type I restriction enzyme S subunit
MSDFNPAEYITIPKGWSCMRLEDCTIDGSISYGIVQPGTHDETGIPVIRVNNVNNGQLDLVDVLKVSPDIEKKYDRTRLKGGEVLLTLVGTTGQSFVAPKELAGWNVPRAIAVIRADETIGADWINICLQSKETKHFLDVRANTTVQKTLNLKDVRDIPILIPPKEEKEAIEGVALSLSQKIELNRKTTQTLEQIAQAIFKSWFVDFEPTRAKIIAKDKGGNEQAQELAAQAIICGALTLDQLTAIEPGYTPLEQTLHRHITEKFPNEVGDLDMWQPKKLANAAKLFPNSFKDGGIPSEWSMEVFSKLAKLDTTSVKPNNEPEKLWEHYSIPAFDTNEAPALELGEEIKSNKYKVNENAILSSKLNPHFPRTWWPDIENTEAAICSTEFMQFVPHEASHRAFVLGTILSKPFQDGIMQSVTGSTGSRQRAQPKQVAELEVLVPTTEIIEYYSGLCDYMAIMKIRNIKQNNTLSKIRDTLLPKLLSGELEISA